MMYREYLENLGNRIMELESQASTVDKAVDILEKAVSESKLIHIFGTDMESASLIASVFFKPGTLINMNPMLDPVIDIAHGAYRNSMMLEVKDLMPCILDYYETVDEGDPIIILGSDPGVRAFREALCWARKKGLEVITITCTHPEGVEVSLVTGDESFSGGTYMALASTLLQLVVRKTGEKVGLENIWDGCYFVDLEKSREKIDRELFLVRHL